MPATDQTSPPPPAKATATDVRQAAQARIRSILQQLTDAGDGTDVARLVRELGVHQIELELQDEELRRVQAALEASRDRYRSMYQDAPVGYVTTSLDGRIVDANELAARLLHMPRSNLLHQSLPAFFDGPGRQRYHRATAQLAGGAHSKSFEVRTRDPPIGLALRIVTIEDEAARLPQFHVALLDISAQLAAKEDRARIAAIVDSSDDMIVGRDLQGRVASWNSGAERLLGYAATERIGLPLTDLLPTGSRPEDATLLRRLRSGENVSGIETQLRHRDGHLVPMSISFAAVRGDDGRVAGTSLIGRDIRERRRIEAMLTRRLRQLDLLARTAEMLIMDDPRSLNVDDDLLAQTGASVGADIALSYRVDAPGEPVLIYSQGLGETQRAGGASLDVFASLAAEAASERRAIVLEGLDDATHPQGPALRAAGLTCFAAFPLLALDRVEAVAAFACSGTQRLQKGDLQVLRTVCDQISATLGRGRLMAELHAREESLRAEDRRKDDFIATLAHELRNPLAPILNAVAILRSTPVTERKLAWCRDIIERQGSHLSVLLEDLLDVSRVTRNKIRLRRERVVVGQLVEHAIETTRPLIEAQRHHLTVSLPERPVEIYADPVRLAQVLGNLLNNAAKYTDPGGEIAVVAKADEQEVSIAIRDNGIGIETDRLAEVFDMFAQLAPALERSRGGLGIGLALSQGLIGLHGGRIEARSAGLGAGSEFVVHLPLAAVQTVAEAPPPRSRPAALVEVRDVLIVDDNRDAAETLAALLALEGITARTALDGLEGLRLLEQWRPAVAVIDIGMPRLNGYALCRLIRAQPWGATMTLIACTGWGQERDRELSRAAGFDHHLVKPVDMDELLACVGAPA